MVSQLGAFAIDTLWIAAALLLWAPVVKAGHRTTRFPPPLQILYLFAALVPHIAIAAFLVMSPYPLYGIFELAPPTGWISAKDDQQIAGVLMWVVAPCVVLWQAGRTFFRWAADDERLSTPLPEPV